MVVTRRQLKELAVQEQEKFEEAIAASLAGPLIKSETPRRKAGAKLDMAPRKRKFEEVKTERRSKRLRQDSKREEEYVEENREDHIRGESKSRRRSTPWRQEYAEEIRRAVLLDKQNKYLGRTPRIRATGRAGKPSVSTEKKSEIKISHVGQEKNGAGSDVETQIKTSKNTTPTTYTVTRISTTVLKVKLKKLPEDHKRKFPAGFFTNTSRIKLGVSPYDCFEMPDQSVQTEVFDLLAKHHAKDEDELSFESNLAALQKSGHASSGPNLFNIVMTCLSVSTENKLMLKQMSALIHKFPFFQNGKKVVSEVPNFHAIRKASPDTIEKAIALGGLWTVKARSIKGILQYIHDTNSARLGRNARKMDIEAANVGTWMDGLLSVDFMQKMPDQEMFDELVKTHGISHKTAACIMCYGFGRSVFAVDTHVLTVSKLLCWVPQSATAEQACAHLNAWLEPRLMDPMHQQFWYHRRRCVRCRGKLGPSTKQYQECVCPIEHLVVRRPNKERKKPKQKSLASPDKTSKQVKPKRGPITHEMDEAGAAAARAAGHEVFQYVIDGKFGADVNNGITTTSWWRYVQDGEVIAKQKITNKKQTKKTTVKGKKATALVAKGIDDEETIVEETVELTNGEETLV